MAFPKEDSDKHEGLHLVAKLKVNQSTAIYYIYNKNLNDCAPQQ